MAGQADELLRMSNFERKDDEHDLRRRRRVKLQNRDLPLL